MTTEQPEALRLADALDSGTYLLSVERNATAAELRRQHSENATQQQEVMEQARLLGISAERELAFRAEVETLQRRYAAARQEIDSLRAANEALRWCYDRDKTAMERLQVQLAAIGAGGVGPLISSSGFDAADMATAAAQGFRDGVASVSAGSEPVAWRLRNTAFRSEVYEYFKTKYLAECRQKQFNAAVDDGGLHDLTPLYAHPFPAAIFGFARAVLAKWGQPAQAAEPVAREPLTGEQIQDLLLCGNPTDEEMRLIRIGWDAAHGILPGLKAGASRAFR